MSNVVIRAQDLRKIYRLYARPSYRFRDIFGLLGAKPNAYTEHAALDGVTLSIRRGEKVAIIGRNGAGKSTFLKLVTGVVEPTSGVLEVTGQFQALLQIGTGFHPDFTGRENVLAYFAQLGMSAAESARKLEEVVDFAELEEYIDQPIKTYSTGMAVRLMFSASTTIHPDLLVLDEVLGVGDAYFANKSYERIVRMCEDEGTTLLLVTHDIYSAVKVCSRVIWIDRGRVVMDSEGSVVVKAYEDSIRQQEEHRMRLKTQATLRAAGEASARDRNLIVEIQARHNRPQPSAFLVAEIALLLDGNPVSNLALGPGTPESGASAHLVRGGTCWGEAGTWHGRTAAPMNNFGSPFHKAAVILDSPVHPLSVDPNRLGVRVTGWSDEPCDLIVRGFSGSQMIEFGPLATAVRVWHTQTLAGQTRSPEGNAALGTINTTGIHGTGTILIEGVDLLDERGASTVFVEHGRPATIVIDYRVQDPEFDGPAQVIVAIYRDGVNTACRFVTDDLRFSARERPRGRIQLGVPHLNLGLGSYSVGVMIAQPNYLNGEVVQFYTVNPGVYASLTRVLEFSVTGKGLVATNTAWVGVGQWSLRDA